ncbi:MAG: pyrroloquinoline quinone biosynthesis protein PqqB [Gemmatimonadaceae bacterium]|nr:pyrroloquinoline quinone biosynthesis protein PqqB [Gemmatimonadaceae bacterium]
MHVFLLGTAAGGGFPQWNCWCPTCRVAREDPSRAHPRSQSSIAFSADGVRWFLGNASPDVREQVATLPHAAVEGVRHVPVEGIVLTDAELDHTLGITLLREGRLLQVIATPAVVHTISDDSRVLAVTQAFATVQILEVDLGDPVPLDYRDGSSSGLTIEMKAVRGDPPRFARRDEVGHTVAAFIRDTSTGKECAFVPGCGGLGPKLLARLDQAELLLFDGTFWTDDELARLDISDRPALSMGHVPVSGVEGSLAVLSQLSCRLKVYTHINNTNPMLVEGSSERAAVEASGLIVGMDGMRFEI